MKHLFLISLFALSTSLSASAQVKPQPDPTFKAYQLNWIPAFFIIDPEGKIIAKAITARGLFEQW